jgi:peptidoglycan-associated lipoprotein
MKKNLFWMGILIVLVFGMTTFTGCAGKKATVKEGAAQEQAAVTAPEPAKADTSQDDADRLAKERAERDAALKAQADRERADRERAAKEQVTKVQAAAPIEIGLTDINFDYDKSNIRPDAREILKGNADYILKNGVSALLIEGHCDDRGTAEYNMALGERRAREAKKYLVNLGIKESILKTISYGKERPLDPADNEEAWAKNRRDHFVAKGN